MNHPALCICTSVRRGGCWIGLQMCDLTLSHTSVEFWFLQGQGRPCQWTENIKGLPGFNRCRFPPALPGVSVHDAVGVSLVRTWSGIRQTWSNVLSRQQNLFRGTRRAAVDGEGAAMWPWWSSPGWGRRAGPYRSSAHPMFYSLGAFRCTSPSFTHVEEHLNIFFSWGDKH